MFDRTEIVVKAGDGGSGVVSFRREKFVPFGGPDGGDGGNGGDVIIRADSSVTTMRIFKHKRLFKAERGQDGQSQKKHGRSGEDTVVSVPVGTVVSQKVPDGDVVLVADLEGHRQQVVVAKGGKGGLGNIRFVSSTNQAPKIAQKGEVGEEATLILELKRIADVGLVGYPNVGKSTLLAAASAAKPQIAAYPFTTREPVLGVVEVGRHTFVLAEIPGLLDGAHLGRGLGHDFLRHVVRTKILIHLVDGSSPSPLEDMLRVNSELALFDAALGQKPQIVAVNKIDQPQVQSRLAEIREELAGAGREVFCISAATGEGVTRLMAEAEEVLSRAVVDAGKKVSAKVFHPQPVDSGATVHKEGGVFVVVAPELERIVAKPKDVGAGVHWQLKRQLSRLGVNKALEKAGIKPGDRVRCGSLEWEW
ncbi:GTPase ObgE [Chloroflexota bacterium]